MTPHELVKDVQELASLPDICVRVQGMLNDPACSAKDFGGVISGDPALTARLLRIANSPFYGFSSQVETVSRAVTIIGTKQLADLILATSAMDVFAGIPNDLVNMNDFWRHSLLCAVTSRILASECGLSQSESIFVAGLLHDIGELVIYHELPQQAREALVLAMEGPGDLDIHVAEQETIGFDHSEVGGELIRAWKLPESLFETVRFHHRPMAAERFRKEASIVHIANSIAVMIELDSTDKDDAPAMSPEAWQLTGLKEASIDDVQEKARDQFSDAERVFVHG